MGTRPWIVDDELWVLIEPLLPPRPERSPGPRPVSDRLCLQGILFVLYNDMAWQLLPPELGFGSGQTCWRRLDRWQKAGVFDRLHQVLLAELNAAGELDCNQTLALVDGVLPVAGRPGRPRRRPEALLGDKGYDSNAHSDELRRRRILPVISRAALCGGSKGPCCHSVLKVLGRAVPEVGTVGDLGRALECPQLGAEVVGRRDDQGLELVDRGRGGEDRTLAGREEDT
ncbi:transposase [Streptomyces sp. NPDC047917]|uniref:transposase n=1 Tax=Streptomyces sp. NPDC047917 TaxID=3365491 RepID=UPI00370FA0F5